jgi:hypothetical protein
MQEAQSYVERKRFIHLLQEENKLLLKKKCSLPRKEAIKRIITLFDGKRIEKVEDFNDIDVYDLAGDGSHVSHVSHGSCSISGDVHEGSHSRLWNMERFLTQMDEILVWLKVFNLNDKVYMLYQKNQRHLISIRGDKSIKILASFLTGKEWAITCYGTSLTVAGGHQAMNFFHAGYCDDKDQVLAPLAKTSGLGWSEFCKQMSEKLVFMRVLGKFVHRRLYDPPNGIRYKAALSRWEQAKSLFP